MPQLRHNLRIHQYSWRNFKPQHCKERTKSLLRLYALSHNVAHGSFSKLYLSVGADELGPHVEIDRRGREYVYSPVPTTTELFWFNIFPVMAFCFQLQRKLQSEQVSGRSIALRSIP